MAAGAWATRSRSSATMWATTVLPFSTAELGDDSSPSDTLVISHGEASGFTGLGIINAGGAGGATLDDGIMVVAVE